MVYRKGVKKVALTLDEVVRVRIAAEDKKLLEEAAQSMHLSLATWARMVLLDAAAQRLSPPLDKSTNKRGEKNETITSWERWQELNRQ